MCPLWSGLVLVICNYPRGFGPRFLTKQHQCSCLRTVKFEISKNRLSAFFAGSRSWPGKCVRQQGGESLAFSLLQRRDGYLPINIYVMSSQFLPDVMILTSCELSFCLHVHLDSIITWLYGFEKGWERNYIIGTGDEGVLYRLLLQRTSETSYFEVHFTV